MCYIVFRNMITLTLYFTKLLYGVIHFFRYRCFLSQPYAKYFLPLKNTNHLNLFN